MSMFDELNDVDGLADLAEEIENPDGVVTDTYPAIITAVKIGKTKDGSKTGITLHYLIDGDRATNENHERFAGRKLTSWQQLPTKDIILAKREGNVKAERVVYYFQQWMNNLGFSAKDRANLSEELFESLEDQEVLISVTGPTKDNSFPQVTRVVIDKEDDDDSGLGAIGGVEL